MHLLIHIIKSKLLKDVRISLHVGPTEYSFNLILNENALTQTLDLHDLVLHFLPLLWLYVTASSYGPGQNRANWSAWLGLGRSRAFMHKLNANDAMMNWSAGVMLQSRVEVCKLCPNLRYRILWLSHRHQHRFLNKNHTLLSARWSMKFNYANGVLTDFCELNWRWSSSSRAHELL